MCRVKLIIIFILLKFQVPKYEVVSIEELKINSDAQVSKPAAAIEFKAFGENHTIKLEETTGYLFGKDTPIWTVQSDPEDFDSPIYIKNNDVTFFVPYSDFSFFVCE